MKIYDDATLLIGHTPLVRLKRLEKKYNLSIEEAHKRASAVYDWEEKLFEDLGEKGEPYGLL